MRSFLIVLSVFLLISCDSKAKREAALNEYLEQKEFPIVPDDQWFLHKEDVGPGIPPFYLIAVSNEWEWPVVDIAPNVQVNYVPYFRESINANFKPIPTKNITKDDNYTYFFPTEKQPFITNEAISQLENILSEINAAEFQESEEINAIIENLGTSLGFYNEEHHEGDYVDPYQFVLVPEIEVVVKKDTTKTLGDINKVLEKLAPKQQKNKFVWGTKITEGPNKGKTPEDLVNEKIDDFTTHFCKQMIDNPAKPPVPKKIQKYKELCDAMKRWKKENKIVIKCRLNGVKATTAPKDGTLTLDGEDYLTDECIRANFFHEFTHVLEFINNKNPASKRLFEIFDEMKAAKLAGDDATFKKLLEEFNKLLPEGKKEKVLSECKAYVATFENAATLSNLNTADGKRWLKTEFTLMIQQITSDWNDHKADLTKEAKAEHCTCVKKLEAQINAKPDTKKNLKKIGKLKKFEDMLKEVCTK